ncbi:WD40 repeat domain-containing protein [Frigoriglobus tundricola]|uniref:Anaphase-promoting complex subunit 4 WD40 domain-containing protein n=1 Tax=Frigoriglobus tundricola TaxID=2774151 RepID=A0A6M5Z3F7_9BACT|nr:WD40 repeat domain-containing protein [Frigoriglobus tundricola]QJW99742.1 hypothetical protein FTUN_7365 [Frigoriglobus tundricola]
MRFLLAMWVLAVGVLSCAAAEPPAKTDRFGDPLPSGALMRLGTLRGAATIASFGVAADGSVVTVDNEGGLSFWSRESDSPEAAVRLPVKVPVEWNGFVRSCVSPDAKRVACCTAEAVIVFEQRGEKPAVEIATFKLTEVESLAFAADGGGLVAVTREGVQKTVHVCDVRTDTTLELAGKFNYIRQAEFSTDGRRVVVNTHDELVLFDTATGKEQVRWAPEAVKLSQIALNAVGDTVAAFVYEPEKEEYTGVRFFDAKTGKPRAGMTGTSTGSWVTFAPDGKTVLVGDNQGVRWWDPIAGKVLRRFEGAGSGLTRFNPDGKLLVGTTGRVLFRWNAKTGEPLFGDVHSGGHFDRITALGVSADGTRYATGGGSQVKVWDARTGKPLATSPCEYLWPQNLEFAPDGKSLFGPGLGSVVQWDTVTGKEIRSFTVDPKEPRQHMTIGLLVANDGKTVTAVTRGRSLGMESSVLATWDAKSGARLATKSLNAFEWNARRYCINFSPGAQFASLHGDVFPTALGPTKGLLPPRTLGPGFDAGAFSGDGGRIAFTFIDTDDPPGTMRGAVYSTATGVKLTDLPAGSGGRVALNADGSVLAAAGRTELTFWDANTGKLLARYKAPAIDPRDTVYSLSFAEVIRFTPDGTKLMTGHADTTALVWPAPPRPAK